MSDELRISSDAMRHAISSDAMRHADAIVSAFSKRLYGGAFDRTDREGRPTVEIADVDAVAAGMAALRLTDAEREAVKEAADAYGDNNDDEGCARIETALRGLLERTGATND